MTLSEVQAITATAKQRLFEQATENVSNLIKEVADKGLQSIVVCFADKRTPNDDLYLLGAVAPNSYQTTISHTITPNDFKAFFEEKGFTVKVSSYGNTREIIKSYCISWR